MGAFSNKGGIFTSIPKKKERRSKFNLSHDVKLSLDMAYLCPVYIQEMIPGDSVRINSTQMLRMAPLVSPVMHKINVYLEYFFVPNRILWDNWETWITGSRNGKELDAIDMPDFPIVQPYEPLKFTNENGSLSDYLGIPTPESFETGQEPDSAVNVSALPFAAYQRIWDEYYRDQNLTLSTYDTDTWTNYNMLQDGVQTISVQLQLSALRRRCFEHDYFTSALPWAQKGEAVAIPMDINYDITGTLPTLEVADGTVLANNNLQSGVMSAPNDDKARLMIPVSGGGYANGHLDNTGAMYNVATINDLRAAVKLQEWLETNARGGSRYFESIYAHFGVKSPDSRLQRPEYIGSNRSSMIISEVLQTSSPQASTDTPQGNMSGNGANVSSSRNFRYYAQEHGFVIGLMSVMPKTAYMQGVERFWRKTQDRLQYYYPEFAHLGEQQVENAELYIGGPLNDIFNTFGYTPRYSEYKFINSRVAGDFRDTLKYWHLGRDFATPPALNSQFVNDDISKRIYAVQDLPDDGGTGGSVRNFHSIYAHVFHDVVCSRLMPKYGTPSF